MEEPTTATTGGESLASVQAQTQSNSVDTTTNRHLPKWFKRVTVSRASLVVDTGDASTETNENTGSEAPAEEDDEGEEEEQEPTTTGKRKRKKRRPAVTEAEDMAILRAIGVVQPHCGGGVAKKRWQRVVELVLEEVGGGCEITPMLCQRRHVILLNRFLFSQELGKSWPENAEMHRLLEAAVAEKKKMEQKNAVNGTESPPVKMRVPVEVATTPEGELLPSSQTPAIVDREDGESSPRPKTIAVPAIDLSVVTQLQSEMATLTARVATCEQDKLALKQELDTVVAAQLQSQRENEQLKQDVADLQLLLQDAASLAGSLHTLRTSLHDHEEKYEQHVKDQDARMQRMLFENDTRRRQVEQLEVALTRERDDREALERIVHRERNSSSSSTTTTDQGPSRDRERERERDRSRERERERERDRRRWSGY